MRLNQFSLYYIISDRVLNHFLNMILLDISFFLSFFKCQFHYFEGCGEIITLDVGSTQQVTLSPYSTGIHCSWLVKVIFILIYCQLYILIKNNCNVNHLRTTSLFHFPLKYWMKSMIREMKREQTQTNIPTLLSKTCCQT